MKRDTGDHERTFLLGWNPDKWPWSDIEQDIATIDERGVLLDRWSVGNTGKIRKGDRVFVIRLGREPRGIVASGVAASEVYQDEHWMVHRREEGRPGRYIDVEFDEILHAETERIVSKQELAERVSDTFRWEIRSSGIEIPPDAALRLEQEWERLIERRRGDAGVA